MTAAVQSQVGAGFVPHGINVFVGTTGTGKTHLAFELLKRIRARQRIPCLLIDSAGAENFQGTPHARDLPEVGRQLNDPNSGIVIWTPEHGYHVDQLFATIIKIGREGKATPLAIMIDEISFWTVEYRSKEFRKLCRLWRHAKVTLLITSQHVSGDLGQVLMACNPLLFLFRTTSPRSLKWIEDNHGASQESIRALPDRQWIEMRF